MSYPTVFVLEQLWHSFDEKVKNISELNLDHLVDIKKLMCADSVIDLSMHEIYYHTEFVHDLTVKLINLSNLYPKNKLIDESCRLWLDILKQRNKIPLKIQHHKKLDGECDFRFTLQLMEGKPAEFKAIQVLNPKNTVEVKEVIDAIHRLDCLSEGISFARLPLVNDIVLSAILDYRETICLIARDQNNQIIGHCWGMLLKDVTLNHNQKANIFWVMDLARDPDFCDKNVKVGERLRAKMVDILKARKDCDFVGYQHILNHKFHTSIITRAQNDGETIRFNNDEFTAKTSVKYESSLGSYFRTHFIRTSNNDYVFPESQKIKQAVFKGLWQAAHSTKDFILGGIAFYGRLQYQRVAHSIHDGPVDQRIVGQVSNEQQDCDIKILKEIILSDQWAQQGKSIFCGRHVPTTMKKLQTLVQQEEVNFDSIKMCAVNSGRSLMRGKLTSIFYDAIATADSPTLVLNHLLRKKETPKAWIDLIGDKRVIIKYTNEYK